uniref:Cation efflux protein transmembrane domain-containing protein n=1 Tax=Glossina palpalis gambiensis TaxID=67801 RepID=A0A1B0BDE6_9MUSC
KFSKIKYFSSFSPNSFSFGWYRAEVIGALVSVIMIWVITAILVWLAIERCVTQDFEVNAAIMLITSGIAIVVNLIMLGSLLICFQALLHWFTNFMLHDMIGSNGV